MSIACEREHIVNNRHTITYVRIFVKIFSSTTEPRVKFNEFYQISVSM